MRGRVSSPGGGSGPWRASASAVSRSGPTRARTPPGLTSNESVTGFWGSPSASSRSTASWRSSSWSKPRSRRSAMPPRTIRMTASQAGQIGVVSSIRSATGKDGLPSGLPVKSAVGGRRVRRWPDGGEADPRLPAHQAGELAGRHAVDGLRELEHEPPVSACMCAPIDAASDGRGAVAKLHAVDLPPRPVQRGAGDLHPDRGERRAGPHHHRLRAGVLADHVERRRAGYAETAPLADREQVLAAVVAHDPAPEVDDRPPVGMKLSVAPQEARTVGPGEEAEVLALRAVGHGQSRVTCDLAHLRLRKLAEREVEPVEVGRTQTSEHVRLVLALVGGAADQGALLV